MELFEIRCKNIRNADLETTYALLFSERDEVSKLWQRETWEYNWMAATWKLEMTWTRTASKTPCVRYRWP